MGEPWTVTSLAQELALSRTHLTRLFSTHMGASPMRFLTEVRLTEFSRLIDETDLSVHQASQAVGWADPRVASAWFSRRFGVTPTRYRHRLPATRSETA
ncbi:helix-turn-helix transcriptional regulator [Propionibacteriaceae bacterium G57]